MKGWIKNLSPGDKVIVNYIIGVKIDTVERLTKTMIVTVDHGRFRKKDGNSCGDSDQFFKWFLEEATPRRVNDVRMCEEYGKMYAEIVDVVDRLKYEHVSYDEIKQIYGLHDKLGLIKKEQSEE